MKRKIIVFLLIILISIQGISAFFVTDLKKFFQDMFIEIDNAKARVEQYTQWAEEIKNMNDVWDQIQKYYKEIKNLPKNAVNIYNDIAKNLDSIQSSFNNLNSQIEQITNDSDEQVKNLNKDLLKIENEEFENEGKFLQKINSTPIRSREELKQTLEERITYLNERIAKEEEYYNENYNILMNAKKLYEEQQVNWNRANLSLQEAQRKVNSKNKEFADDILSDNLNDKQIQQTQLFITALNIQCQDVQRQADEFKKNLDRLEKNCEDYEYNLNKIVDRIKTLENEKSEIEEELKDDFYEEKNKTETKSNEK